MNIRDQQKVFTEFVINHLFKTIYKSIIKLCLNLSFNIS